MSQRTGLIIAVILTAFMLVIGGAVIGRTTQPEKPPVETTAVQQQAVQQLMERESAYQDLARQANERLQQAYTKLKAQAQASATASAMVLSAEQAANIAVQMAQGATLLNMPELVNFQGALAYKVSLNKGIVIIDASSGQVLFNGITTLVSVKASNNGQGKSGGNAEKGGDHEQAGGEHESGDGDD
jgi:hypothetical protein